MATRKFLGTLFTAFACYLVTAQTPLCTQDHFYEMGINNCIWRYDLTNIASPSGTNPSLPSGANGLALGPNFFANGPAITYYTVLNGNYYYYNGSSFVNTGHSAGGAGFDNPGGSANYIYNVNSSGQISRYNGTGAATVIATHSIIAGVASLDIAGDANNNYYVVRTASPACINAYDANSNLLSSYPLFNLPLNAQYSNGFALNKGKLSLSPAMSGGAATGQLINNQIEFGVAYPLACGGALDMASCPDVSYLVPAIRGIPSASLPCNGGTIALTSDDSGNTQTYTWSGPGIVGASTTQSIVVNATGVYTRTMVTIGGITDVSTFTVYQGTWLPLQVATSNTVKCDYSAPITMTASGLGNYIWTPAASLSSATGSVVSANPQAITSYTVNGTLNGCVGSTVVTITAAAAIPTPSITVPNPTICIGDNGLLSTTAGSLNVQWLPGNYTTNFVIVTPTATSVYTLVLSNSIGCSKTATAVITVAAYPTINAAASKTLVCAGESVNLSMMGANNFTTNPGNLVGSSLIINPVATTVYTITGANAGCTNAQQLQIDVMPLPQFSVSSSANQICVGQSASITALGNGNTYTVLPGNQVGSVVVVNPTVSQVYTVVASNQSCTAMQQLPLTVNALPQINVGTGQLEICEGEYVNLTAFGGITYTWSTGGNNSVLQVSPVTTTTYQVQGSSAEGCVGSASIVQKVNACTGIGKMASNAGIRFYPNPGNGIIEVQAAGVSMTARVEVRNNLGQIVLEAPMSESIDISAFAKGVYVISVLDNSVVLYRTKYLLQ